MTNPIDLALPSLFLPSGLIEIHYAVHLFKTRLWDFAVFMISFLAVSGSLVGGGGCIGHCTAHRWSQVCRHCIRAAASDQPGPVHSLRGSCSREPSRLPGTEAWCHRPSAGVLPGHRARPDPRGGHAPADHDDRGCHPAHRHHGPGAGHHRLQVGGLAAPCCSAASQWLFLAVAPGSGRHMYGQLRWQRPLRAGAPHLVPSTLLAPPARPQQEHQAVPGGQACARHPHLPRLSSPLLCQPAGGRLAWVPSPAAAAAAAAAAALVSAAPSPLSAPCALKCCPSHHAVGRGQAARVRAPRRGARTGGGQAAVLRDLGHGAHLLHGRAGGGGCGAAAGPARGSRPPCGVCRCPDNYACL